MHLGIFAKTFARPTLAETLNAVAAHGLRCVQFNFACAGLPSMPDRIDPALADVIRREFDARRITMAAVSGTFNMIHPDPQHRRNGLRRLRGIASVCARLGASVITLCTGTRDPQDMWQHHPDNATPAAWRDLRATMTEALAAAAEFNVTLAVEPEVNNIVASARHARRLLDELNSPHLKIIMDAANLLRPDDLPRQRAIVDEAFDLLGRDLVLAHAKEISAAGHPGDLALGTGVLDWPHVLSALRRAGFAGPLIMHGFSEAAAPASVAFLRGRLDSAVASLDRSG
ncbi:MAG: sugar phosphate isomerase/epimerase [Verrucomicrobia bacterium]|nr:sugar phosphate isomerase/epimerase [Verrucomicrobiota bacterium]